MSTFALTAALPGRAPAMLAEIGEVRGAPGAGRLAREQLLALVGGADVALTMLYDRVDEEFLDAAGPSLRGVCNVAVGFDNIDLAACAQRIHRRENFLYERRFVRNMRRRLLATGRFHANDLAGLHSVIGIDDRITAPYSGFSGAN